MITQSELKELVRYNKDTGEFVYIKPRKRIKVGDTAGRNHSKGYWVIGINGRQYLAHRLAWLYITGEWPSDQVDHINHDRSDNRWGNLREATNKINHQNRPMQKNNKSGFTGVFWEKAINKWRSQIKVGGKKIHLGVFDNLSDAISTRQEANNRYGFHVNHGCS
jgi:hypothetical protein